MKPQIKIIKENKMELELKCKCGATAKLIKPDDSSYTDGEGYYTRLKGDIGIAETHDVVYFKCNKCGNEIWMFT
jgi:hypothetical protein